MASQNYANVVQVWKCLYSLALWQCTRQVVGLGHLRRFTIGSPKATGPTGVRRGGRARHQPRDVVADAAGKPINRTFYGPELQKVIPMDYFDVETILDICLLEKTTLYLIKWACYTDSFNSWESNMVQNNGDSITLQKRHHGWLCRGALLTALWSSYCPAMSTKCFTHNTSSRTSWWSCQSASCCTTMCITKWPWPA